MLDDRYCRQKGNAYCEYNLCVSDSNCGVSYNSRQGDILQAFTINA